jgi:hypothetical protein
MFGTMGILNTVERIGMVEFLKYFQSDHRGIYLDLYVCNIFEGLLHPLQQRQARKVQLKSKKQTKKYLQQATSNIEGKQIKIRLKQIMNNPPQYSHEDLDRVNTDFHQGLVEAAESLAPYPVHWWTKEIEEKYKVLQYWFAELTFEKCKTVGEDILRTLTARLPQKADVYQGNKNRNISQQLRLATKNLQKSRSDSFKKRQKELQDEVEKNVGDKEKGEKGKIIQKRLKGIKATERRMGMFRKIKKYTK